MYKYVDDTTLSEVLQPKRLNSSMEIYIQNLIKYYSPWTEMYSLEYRIAC